MKIFKTFMLFVFCLSATQLISQSATCYAVSENGSDNELYTYDPVTGMWSYTGQTCTDNIEAVAYDPFNDILYATNRDILGTLDITPGSSTAGKFTPKSTLGTVNGDYDFDGVNDDILDISDVDGLSYDPVTGILWASDRINGNGNPDILFAIDIATCQIIPDQFGPGQDYVSIPPVNDPITGTALWDIDDIAWDPFTGRIYMIQNQSGLSDVLTYYDVTTDNITIIGSISPANDMEGLGFNHLQQLFGTTGNAGGDGFFMIDINDASTTMLSSISTVDTDFESVDCLTTWSDLALDKNISSTQTTPITSGDQVCFDIEVYNQGQVVNYNIELTDYIPTGLTLNDPAWSASPPDANYSIPGPLMPGASIVVPICFTVNAGFSGVITNTAEISGSEDVDGNDLPDIDSVPDDTNDETGVVDNEINENGPLLNEDEDDHDIANITIVEAPDCVVSSNSPICEGQNLSLAESGGDASMWAWSGPNGFTSTNQNPSLNSVTAAASGTYVVTVTSMEGATSVCDVEVTVSAAPTVTIEDAGPFCEDDANATLVASPAGGTWSGDGITNNSTGVFNPSVASTGTHTITYTYVDAFGCSSSESIDIVVNAEPVITFPAAGPLCENDAAVSLSAMPSGGTYSGPGISGANFNPTVAGAGTHTVTYSFVDANGCSSSEDIMIVVNPIPTVFFDPAGPFCISDNALNLSVNPSGGTFSGAGITDGMAGTFDPSVAGVGTTTITYLYTNGNGCSTTETLDIEVTQQPAVVIDPAGPFCIDAASANLVASPTGGTWSGEGITSASAGTFNPGVAGVGAHTITYEYIDASGCEGGETIDIIVHALPAVELEDAGPFCITDASIDLMGTPSGGVYSGDGITNAANGTFDPATAGAGTHTITFTYTDDNGCSADATIDIVVNNTPSASITPAGPFCIDGADEDLEGSPVGGLWSGMGISNSVAGTFSPSAAGVGSHTVSYTFTDPNGCSVITTTDVVVNPLPTITPGAAMCSADLMTYDIDLTTTGDVLSLTLGTVVDNGGGSFDITDIPAGSNIIITSTDSSTGCSSDMAITSPDCACSPIAAPTMIANGMVCQGEPNPELSVSVDAGLTADWWDMLTGGTLVAANSLTFTSTETAPGMYTYFVEAKDPATGCVSSPRIPVELTIFPNPVVGLDPAGPYCINDAEATLMAMPTDGMFSGIGITDESAGTFDPATAGAGTHTVIYEYVDANGCENSATIDIVVNALPVVAIETAGPLCVEEDAILLEAIPIGGTWSGMGITDANAGQFDPSVAGVGTHTISYMFRDGNGCEATVAIDIEVTSIPAIEITPAGPFCVDEESLNLDAIPAGGTWAGTGITDPNQGTFSPGGAGVGTHEITYSYSDGSGCEGTAIIDIVVNPLPSLMITPAGPFCPNEDEFELTGTPMGGTWSGPGIADTNVSEFDPAAAGPGTHTITYAFVDPNGCEFEVEEEIIVHPETIIDLPTYGPFCVTDTAEDLGGTTLPGMWSGMGITDAVNGTFDPAVAGVGVHIINYMLVDENGCEWMETVDIEVLPIPTITAEDVSCSIDLLTYIISVTTDGDDLTSTLGTVVDNGGGSWTVSDIPGGMTVALTAIITGSTCSTTLDVSAPDCECEDVNAPVDPNNPSICEGDDIPDLLATVGAGEHIDWYDSATGGNLLLSNSSTYTPTVASVSGTYTFYAEAIDDATACVSPTRTRVTLQINALPIVTTNPAGPFCETGGAMDLSGTPVGGTWSGNGITDANVGTFDPANAGVGSHDVTYTYIDANGCFASVEITIEVNPLPVVTAEPAGPFCSTGDIVMLVGSPAGGTWSGVGADAAGNLDPTMANVGITPYTYVYVDPNGCTATAEIMVEITAGPEILSETVDASCEGSDGEINLTVTGASPFTFTWNDATTTEDRTGLAAGSYIVTVTDVNGCETEGEYEILEGECEYDLAIDKAITSAGPYMPGSTVTYTVTIENEGMLDAANVTFTDVPQTGLVYVMSDASGNANVTESSPLVFDVASLPVGATEVVTLTFTIDAAFTGTSLVNDVSITADDGDDVDSDPATDDTVDEDGDGDTDDDDEGEVVIMIGQIYDLAIDKVVTSVGPYAPGSTVTYEVEIENEGTMDAANVTFTDVPQTGLLYVMSDASGNANVTESSPLVFDVASLPVGATEVVTLTFTIDAAFTGTSLVNDVSITADDGDDVDSDPATDDTVDEDGDGDTDDDDEGEVEIVVQPLVYDLAIDKVVTSAGPYAPGSTVTYEVEIENEGTMDAANITFTDVPQTGLVYVMSDAATLANVTESSPLVFDVASLPVGATEVVTLTFTIDAAFTGTSLVNDVSITADDGDDVDSDPATDDTVDEDGDGDTDDDDEGEVVIMIGQIYDLAIDKVVTSAGPYAPGSTVTYEVEIENEGTMDAANVTFTDVPQTGLVYVMSDVSGNANVTESSPLVFDVASLPVGATEVVTLTFTIDAAFTGASLVNDVSITADDGDDVDSDPATDDTVDEDGDGDTDDDDEGEVVIMIGQIYDLAIDKVVTSAGPYAPGSTVTYEVEIENEGTMDAANVTFTDVPQTGLLYVMSDASGNANVTESSPLVFDVASLPVGATETVILSFTIDAAFAGTSLVNDVSITADDGDDADSDPATDDTVDEDGDGDTDDDDEAEVVISLEQSYDLAIDKVVVSAGPYSPGSTVSYMVTIENEGTLDANNITFTDVPEAGLVYVMSDASGNTNITESSPMVFDVTSLPAGVTETVMLSFTIDVSFAGTSLTNDVSITADDGDDVDSDPATDDTVDEDGDGDTDDDDEAEVVISLEQSYDLAIDKVVVSAGPYSPGSTVSYMVTIENEGTLDANNVTFTDVPEAGLVYVMSDASGNTNITESSPMVFDVTSLPAGATETVMLSFTIDVSFAGTSLTNDVSITADDGDDIDSDPATDDTVDEDGDGDTDDDDEAEATIVIGSVYDLAIDKVVTSAGPYTPGSTVTYLLTLENQGSLDAANVQFLDTPQPGLVYLMSDAAANANISEPVQAGFIAASLPAGTTETVTLTYTISPTFTGSSLLNKVEIVVDDGDDIDSDPMTDDTVDEDGDGNGDDDDEAEALITLEEEYDLALFKVVTTTGPYVPGQNITYGIIVTNQGAVDANNVEFTDIIPSDLIYVSSDAATNPNITETSPLVFEAASLPVGGSSGVVLTFQIDPSFAGGAIVNDAMITADDGDDIDSDPATDDSVDEDGDGDPSDDDESEVTIVVESYDLAITKTETSTGPYAPGSTVAYALTIENQGTITANNVLLTDTPQAGLNYVSSDAASNPNVFENANIEFGVVSLAPGATETINVSFMIDAAFTGASLINNVEITADDGDDVDSDPNTDNTVDEDGDGNGDDDDEGQAEIVLGQTYDLAIMKAITSAGPYSPGSVVSYILTVENQGTTDANNIEVIDLPDAGLVYTMSDAAGNGNVTEVATLEFEIASLAAGATETINVSFTIDAAFTGTSLVNYTEIIADDGDDIDSDPDTDNTVDEDGDGNPDDDDEDLVVFDIEMTYDLALDKAVTSTGPYSPGSTVTYSITIENEGDVAANNIVFTDNPSAGLNYVMSDASANANVTELSSTMFEVLSLAPGATETVILSFVIDPAFTGTSLSNTAEIIGDDGDDVDSDPMTDETVDEDGDGNGDDDDEDQESILIGAIYDLALTKVETSSAPYTVGDPVTFAITVENQGTMDAANIQVTDSPMAGLIYVMSDATGNANVNETGALIFDVINLPAGATETINVSFTIDPTFTGSSLTNNAEITSDDGDDIDSDPMTSDNVDEDGDGNGDDDDEDAATIMVGQVYDLAIDKVVVSVGPYSPGSTVSYDITITNEGVVDAVNVQLADVAQAGLTYGWSDASSNANVTESTTLVFDVASLPAGQSETVNVTFTIDASFTGSSLDNWVQITGDDGDDIDSDPATDETVDEDGDGNGDDDDEDVETISVGQLYDLALTKQVTSAGPYMPGSTVTYAITIENEGMIAASNIQVMDMSAAGLNYVMSDAFANGNVNENLAQLFEIVSLAPGATETVNLSFTIDAAFAGTSLSNDAMIVADDGDDVDSDPATDATVDEDGDGNGDDDDEDSTIIMIGQVYDLAIDKLITSAGPYAPGSVVSYSITVTNEGTLPATNVQVTEAPQAGLNYQSSDAGTNANVNELATTLYEILSLPAGASEVINVDFVIDASFAGSSLDNAAMISLDDGDDIDSDPNTDATVDEDGDGNGDDDDEALVSVMIDQVFDLSLEKTLATPGTFAVFDDVDFAITVSNDGTLPAFNVDVVDYIPTGFMLSPNDTNGWTVDANGDAHNSIAGPIAPGATATVNILVRVTQEAYLLGLTTIENVAEIENAENANGTAAIDIDSNPDGTEDNDSVDEDDIDPEMIELMELDPLGYIYCEKTGAVITGGLITVTGPGNITFGTDAAGAALDGSNGLYQFFVDAPGVYDISYSHPSGYPLSTTCSPLAGPFDPSNVDGTAQDKDGTVNNSIVLGSDATAGYLDDFTCGYNEYFLSVELEPNDPPLINLNNLPVSCVVISGTVCEDTDSNGTGDATDPGRDGMTVNLFDCADLTTVIATTQTANGGQYSFEGLVAGCYQVQFDIPTGFGVLPGGFVDLNGNSVDTTLDWGECIVDGDFCISQVGSLGDYVWKDLDGDGLQTVGEPGVEGVIVNLFDCAGMLVGTTTTDIDGAYSFDGLIPGSYRVQFDITSLPAGCVFTTPNNGADELDSDADATGNTTCVDVVAGTDNPDLDAGLVALGKLGDFVWNDCNGNGIQDAGEPGVEGIQVLLKSSNGVVRSIQYTDANGLYLFENINPGLYYVEFVLPFDYEFTLPHLGNSLILDSDVVNINGNNTGSTSMINVTVGDCDLNAGDAGIFTCVPIGDQIWFDINQNNIMDPNENGLNGIRVNLYRLMPGGYVLWDYQHTDQNPDTPSDDGYYKFCAPPGTYYVEYVNPPLGLVPAMPQVGSSETDSDITGSNGLGTTDTFSVNCGQDISDLDAGFHPMGTIGDFAFMDQNQNGLREAFEPGVPNVVVEAYDNTGTLIGMDITNQDGQFMIDYLQQRDVFLKFIPPSNLASTLPNIGAENIDSDVDNSNGYMTTSFYDIQSGEHQANVDAGFIFGAVAVDWLDFVGENEGQYNWLEWTVANELNVSHYEVERSIDGVGDFITIDKVLSMNSNENIKVYNLNDFDISQAGLYYYRIKQVDLNGEYDYSKVIIIDVARDENQRFIASIYPNPAIDNFTLEVEIGTEGQELGYEIFDFTGKKVRTLVTIDSNLSIGKHMTKVDITDLTPGVYTLKIISGVYRTNKKFIVVSN